MSSAPVVCGFESAKHSTRLVAGVCFIGIGGGTITDARNLAPD